MPSDFFAALLAQALITYAVREWEIKYRGLFLTRARLRILRSIDEINSLVECAETDGKGMPVLLRQYLKLNARLIGFNVDPAFGEALDALMLVDLTTVDLPILNRYLGRANAKQVLAYHDANRQATEAA